MIFQILIFFSHYSNKIKCYNLYMQYYYLDYIYQSNLVIVDQILFFNIYLVFIFIIYIKECPIKIHHRF